VKDPSGTIGVAKVGLKTWGAPMRARSGSSHESRRLALDLPALVISRLENTPALGRARGGKRHCNLQDQYESGALRKETSQTLSTVRSVSALAIIRTSLHYSAQSPPKQIANVSCEIRRREIRFASEIAARLLEAILIGVLSNYPRNRHRDGSKKLRGERREIFNDEDREEKARASALVDVDRLN